MNPAPTATAQSREGSAVAQPAATYADAITPGTPTEFTASIVMPVTAPAPKPASHVVETTFLPGIKHERLSDGSVVTTVLPVAPQEKTDPGPAPAGYRVVIGVDQPSGVKPMGPGDFLSLNATGGPLTVSRVWDANGQPYNCVGISGGMQNLNVTVMGGTVVRGGDAAGFLRGASLNQSGAYRHVAGGVSYTPDGQIAVAAGLSLMKSDFSTGPSYCWKVGEHPLTPLREMVSPGNGSGGGVIVHGENSITE